MNDMLTISTLGGLSIRCRDEPVTGFASRKVEALLVYLTCTGRPRPREVVAEMLWEERSQSQALANLRVVLSSLRKHLGPYVTITRDTVALNPDADVWLDAAELERKLSAGQVEEAVALYHGDFLEGFFVRDCPDFEDWAAIEREPLRRLVLDGLCDLVADCLETGEYQSGTRHTARLLELDPLTEESHRQMMRLLANSGQRAAALEQYETCRQLLSGELGMEPAEETVALCERIRAGELDVLSRTPTRPHSLTLSPLANSRSCTSSAKDAPTRRSPKSSSSR